VAGVGPRKRLRERGRERNREKEMESRSSRKRRKAECFSHSSEQITPATTTTGSRRPVLKH